MTVIQVNFRRRVRPLKKSYDPERPFVYVRNDEEDGSCSYDIWDTRPESAHMLCTVFEPFVEDTRYDDLDDIKNDGRGRALMDAIRIVNSLNLAHQLGKKV